CQQYNTDPHNF
nr:immunoglobulin light chain junction region [Macaca mulatta]